MMQADSGDVQDGEDRALLEGVRRGDEGSFRALFDRHYRRVHAFAIGRLGNPELCEEIAADVFFEVWRHARHYRGESRVSTWIFGIAHFKCLGALRRERAPKRAQIVLPDNVEYLHRVPDERDEEELVRWRDDLQRVLVAIDALPEAYREVIELALVEGLSYDEIAERLGIGVANVKTRVSRARARLRRRMGRGE